MKIIEFYGLPGSGKSTLSHQIIEKLCLEGFSIMDYKSYTACKKKGFLIKGLLNFQGLKFFFYAIMYLIKNRLLFRTETVKRLIFCLSFIVFYQDKSINTSDYVILDEGIIQGIVSSLFDYESECQSFKWFTDIIKKNSIQTIYVEVSLEHADERIEMRKTFNHGRCDAMNSEERISVLRVQANNFDKVFKTLDGYSGNIKVDGMESIELVVDYIRKHI